MLRTTVLAILLLGGAALQAGQQTLDLSDEVVCKINTESVSLRQVEERMEDIAIKLKNWRRAQEEAGQFTDEAKKKYDELYIPPFRDALRRVVRERLMLQYAKSDKTPFDERAYEKRLTDSINKLKEAGVWGGKNFTMADVQKRVRENMTIENYRYQFASFLDYPSKPEVKAHYEQNKSRYQRKPGVKVRVVRIDRIVTDKLTGKQRVNPNAYEDAGRLRDDVVNFQGNFAEVARAHSNDEESRERGGLIVLNAKDQFIDPDNYNPQLARAIDGVKAGDVSRVFELGQSYAFALVEARREAGDAPLDDDLYQEIYHQLFQQKTRKKEDEWFRKALSKSLVTQVVEGKSTTLPVEFFFPDDNDKPRAEKTEKSGR